MDEQRSVTDVPAATHRRPARGEEETRTTPSPAKLARLEPGIALVGLFVLSIVYTLYFLLATGDTFLRKLVQIVPGHPDKNRAVAMIRTIEGDIAR
ncbi:MAG: hypothetical protein HY322_02070, partial [Betaproteobacteria bacterium]|nr:hypothetical protein [Betaproteobacteria bacterium]